MYMLPQVCASPAFLVRECVACLVRSGVLAAWPMRTLGCMRRRARPGLIGVSGAPARARAYFAPQKPLLWSTRDVHIKSLLRPAHDVHLRSLYFGP